MGRCGGGDDIIFIDPCATEAVTILPFRLTWIFSYFQGRLYVLYSMYIPFRITRPRRLTLHQLSSGLNQIIGGECMRIWNRRCDVNYFSDFGTQVSVSGDEEDGRDVEVRRGLFGLGR